MVALCLAVVALGLIYQLFLIYQPRSLEFVVDIFAISDCDDDNQKLIVFDGVHDAKVAGAHSPEAIVSY